MNTLKKEYTNETRKISLTYDYEGESIPEKTLAILDKNMNSLENFEPTYLINCIRIILHNHKDTFLDLKFKSDYLSYEVVLENNELKLFTKKENIDVDCGVETKYKDKSFFDIRLTGPNIDEVISKIKTVNGKEEEISVFNFYQRLIKGEIKKLKSMKSDLSEEARLLACYKLFYQSDASMSDKDAEDKLQIMTYLLKKFGLADFNYRFASNEIGYEYFNMSFDKAYLPRADEVKIAKETGMYVEGINEEDIEIPHRESIVAISEIIKDTTNFDLEWITELVIVLHVYDQLKKATIEEAETGRKAAMENAMNMEKRVNEIYKQDSIASVKKLLNTLNTKFTKQV